MTILKRGDRVRHERLGKVGIVLAVQPETADSDTCLVSLVWESELTKARSNPEYHPVTLSVPHTVLRLVSFHDLSV